MIFNDILSLIYQAFKGNNIIYLYALMQVLVPGDTKFLVELKRFALGYVVCKGVTLPEF